MNKKNEFPALTNWKLYLLNSTSSWTVLCIQTFVSISQILHITWEMCGWNHPKIHHKTILIVNDFTEWAKKRSFAKGSARGTGGWYWCAVTPRHGIMGLFSTTSCLYCFVKSLNLNKNKVSKLKNKVQWMNLSEVRSSCTRFQGGFYGLVMFDCFLDV